MAGRDGTAGVGALVVPGASWRARDADRGRSPPATVSDVAEAELKKRTLTNLYNQRPTWLDHAHATLDRAVWAAYGWDDPEPEPVPDDVILERLLALNSARSK